MTKKKLYVGNLPLSAEENQLQVLFGTEGRIVKSVQILKDRASGRSRGFGFVEMGSAADAQRAIEALNGYTLMGRSLSVTEAREHSSPEDNEPMHPRLAQLIHRGKQKQTRQ